MITMIKRGFTFIELLITVAVIAVLIGAVLVVIKPEAARAKVRDSQRINDLLSIKSALELFFTDVGSYPISGPTAGGCSTSVWEKVGGEFNSPVYSCLYNSLTAGSPPYLNELPRDPKAAIAGSVSPSDPCDTSQTDVYRYNYITNSDGSRYALTAILETQSLTKDHTCATTDLTNWSWANDDCGGVGAEGSALPTCYGVQNP